MSILSILQKVSVCVGECGYSMRKELSLRRCEVQWGGRYLEFIFNWDHFPCRAQSEISDLHVKEKKGIFFFTGWQYRADQCSKEGVTFQSQNQILHWCVSISNVTPEPTAPAAEGLVLSNEQRQPQLIRHGRALTASFCHPSWNTAGT